MLLWGEIEGNMGNLRRSDRVKVASDRETESICP